MLKRVKTDGSEAKIATMLSADTLREDPTNHCVPILDIFQDDKDDSLSYIVMPYLRLVDTPPMKHVNEVIDLVDQLLEVRPGQHSLS